MEAPEIVQLIHSSPYMACIAVTGGGMSLFPMLVGRGNASRTLIHADIPYAPEAHEDYVKGKPDQWVSEADSRAMAMVAFQKAVKFKPAISDYLLGLGATLSLAKVERTPEGSFAPERPGRMHSYFMSLQTPTTTISHSLTYQNDAPNLGFDGAHSMHIREEEEFIAAQLMINLLARGCLVPNRTTDNRFVPLIKSIHYKEIHPQLNSVVFGTTPFVCVRCRDGNITPVQYNELPLPTALIPGSFNPIHDAHKAMRIFLENSLKAHVSYEMAVTNVDKSPLDYLTIQERLQTIAQSENALVYLTNAPTFVEKSKIFPNCHFGVGYDTAARIVDPKYYGGPQGTYTALNTMDSLSTRFIVFGRHSEALNKYLSLEDIADPFFQKMSRVAHLPPEVQPISSSKIRRTAV